MTNTRHSAQNNSPLENKISHRVLNLRIESVPCCGEGGPRNHKGTEHQSEQSFQRQNNAQGGEADHRQQTIAEDAAGAPEIQSGGVNEVENALQRQTTKDTKPIYVTKLHLKDHTDRSKEVSDTREMTNHL